METQTKANFQVLVTFFLQEHDMKNASKRAWRVWIDKQSEQNRTNAIFQNGGPTQKPFEFDQFHQIIKTEKKTRQKLIHFQDHFNRHEMALRYDH